MRALEVTPEPDRAPAGPSGASDARGRDEAALNRVAAIVSEYQYLHDRILALRQHIAMAAAANESLNRFAPPDQQIPVVLTGDEVLEILNGDIS